MAAAGKASSVGRVRTAILLAFFIITLLELVLVIEVVSSVASAAAGIE